MLRHPSQRLANPPLDLISASLGIAIPPERNEFPINRVIATEDGVAGVGVGLAFDAAGEVDVEGVVAAELVVAGAEDGEVAGEGAEGVGGGVTMGGNVSCEVCM